MASTILLITAPGDTHADEVIHELSRRGVPVFRFHPEDYPRHVSLSFDIRHGKVDGEIVTRHRSVRFSDICAAWYRRPNAPVVLSAEVTPEAVEYVQEQALCAIRTLYSVLDTFWVSHPVTLRSAEVKMLQLIKASEAGLLTPRTLLSNDPEKAASFCQQLAPDRCAIKSQRVVGAYNIEGWRLPLTAILPPGHSLETVALSPVILQPYIEKAAELRCVVMDDVIFAVKLNTQLYEDTAIDWRGIKLEHLSEGGGNERKFHEVFALPKHIENAIHRLMNSFNIIFASIDMIITPEGDFVFLELNPNGQWLWLEKELGIPLVATMADLLMRYYTTTD